jgi:uncharacterized protein YcbK (DUF882 family)
MVCLATLAPIQAGTNERTLRFYNTHTGEHATITYKRNGQYSPEGLRAANLVLRDWRRNEPATMDPKLLDLVWEVYQESGSNEEIHIVSGYRAPATNAMLRQTSSAVAENSQHMAGKAMDFYLPDVPLSRLRALGLQLQIGGVGYYPSSGSPFIHLDTGSPRHWPRMTRTQLASVFPEGRTLHIPSDGNPLPGYQQALAEYRSQGYVTPASREAATFLADLYGGSGARVPTTTVVSAPIQVASAAPAPAAAAPATTPPLPRIAPRDIAAEAGVMVAAVVPPLPRPAPNALRLVVPVAAPSTDLGAIQVASAAPADITPPAGVGDATAVAPGQPVGIPAMAFAAEFAGSWPDPFSILSNEIATAEAAAPAAAATSAAAPPQPATPAPALAAPPNAPRLAVASLGPSFSAPMDLRPTSPAIIPEPEIEAAAALPSQGLSIWTTKVSTRQGEMAELSPPVADGPALLSAPEEVYAAGFGAVANGDLRTDRFSGSSVGSVSVAFVLAPGPVQLASR